MPGKIVIMTNKIKSIPTRIYILGLYLITRLAYLTRLPVFADEAIYIRWAQLGLNEPDKYILLSMLDGKPPLHNWLIKPFLFIFKDPLFAGRFLSVLAGGVTIYFMYKITHHLTKNKDLAFLSAFLATILPFWVTNHRLALAESLLSLFFTAGLYFGIRAFKDKKKIYTLLFGLSFGLSLWTKTNALFFIPVYALIPLLISSRNKKQSKKNIIKHYISQNTKRLVVGGVFGALIFLSLKWSDLFPFLFSRSKDYTFSLLEIIGGEWQYAIFTTIPRVTKWILWYMVPSSLVIMFYEKKINKTLLLMTLSYMAPLILFGRVLSSRYFFPIATLLNLMIINGLKNSFKNPLDKKVTTVMLYITILGSIIFSTIFITNPDNTPFVSEDRTQYLEDWSSGHGIPQVRDFIKERIKTTKVTVATEGYFGTLPDGLLMYFDKSPDIINLELYGIGQPIGKVNQELLEKSADREVYIVANSHRLNVKLEPSIQKIAEYARPNDAPSLILLKITPTKP